MRILIQIQDPHWKKMDPDSDPDPGYFFTIYWIFLTKQIFQICRLNLYAKTWWTIAKSGSFYNLFFSIVHVWVLRVNFFFAVFGWFLPLGSGSVDPHIFADPDPEPGSQNLADPTDPDPNHCTPVPFTPINLNNNEGYIVTTACLTLIIYFTVADA